MAVACPFPLQGSPSWLYTVAVSYPLFLLGYHSCILPYKFQSSGKDEGKDTVFTRGLKASIRERKPLRINRLGLVKLSEEAEKPLFTVDELYRNRQ